MACSVSPGQKLRYSQSAMAICRSLLLSRRFSSSSSSKLFSLFRSISSHSPTALSNSIAPLPNPTLPTPRLISIHLSPNNLTIAHTFTSTSDPPQPINRNPKLVNFSLPESESDSEEETQKKIVTDRKSKLPPPYDPFNKKPAIEDPDDPKNLQEVFHRMRTEGLTNHAVKMFDGLSKDGLTHEALELFRIIKDKGTMPDVVAHTAVIEAYADAGQLKEALKVFLRMLSSGVAPNAYTYTVIIKGLARGDEKMVQEANKYLIEMVGKGMKPNVGTYAAVLEALVKEGKEKEARETVKAMKEKGFEFDRKSVMEVLKGKKGPAKFVLHILFGK